MLKHILIGLICLTILSTAIVSTASAATIEKLGEPCRAFNVLGGRYVKDPAGKEWLVLTNMNETTHCELIFIDIANNTAKTFPGPAGQGSWSINVVPGDRIIVGTYFDGTYMTFDLKQMAFTKTAQIKGEGYIWSSALGSDGRLYGGTYPNAHLAALDLNTNEIEDFGNPAPPNHYLRNVSALPDGRLYCQFMMDKGTHLVFDPKTKQFTPVPAGMEKIDTGVSFDGCFISGASFGGQGENDARVFKGDTLEPIDIPPFPIPHDGSTWSADVYASNSDALIEYQGNKIYRCRAGAKELETIFVGDHNGRVIDQTPDGRLLIVRGQDYAVIKPGDTEMHLMPIPAEKGPRPPMWLRADPQGNVWGGPTFGQTCFYTDPKTSKTINTGAVCNAGGEVYDAAFLNGKTYMVAYSEGDIIDFDPSQPWDQIHNKNPRTISHIIAQGIGYARPGGGIVAGPDGKLYSGWMAKYGTYGGAVAITDPATGKTDLIENPLGKAAIGGVAVDDKFIYAGTNGGANGMPTQDITPVFGMIDRETHQVVYQEPIKNGGRVGHMVYDPKTARVAVTITEKIGPKMQQTLRIFDPATHKWSDDTQKVAHSLIGLGDGKIYSSDGPKINQLDLATGAEQTVATLSAPIDIIAVAADGTMFAACGTTLYAVHP